MTGPRWAPTLGVAAVGESRHRGVMLPRSVSYLSHTPLSWCRPGQAARQTTRLWKAEPKERGMSMLPGLDIVIAVAIVAILGIFWRTVRIVPQARVGLIQRLGNYHRTAE